MWPCWGDDIWKQTRRSWENNHVHFYQQWIQKKEKTDRKAMGQKYGDMFQEYQGHQCGCRGISYNCDVLHAAHMLLLRGRNFRDAVKYWNLPAGFRYAVKYWICLHNFRYVVKYWICLQCKRPGLNPWVRKIPWRRKWQPTPIFLPGESHGQRSLAGYSPYGHRVRHPEVTQHVHTPRLRYPGHI